MGRDERRDRHHDAHRIAGDNGRLTGGGRQRHRGKPSRKRSDLLGLVLLERRTDPESREPDLDALGLGTDPRAESCDRIGQIGHASDIDAGGTASVGLSTGGVSGVVSGGMTGESAAASASVTNVVNVESGRVDT